MERDLEWVCHKLRCTYTSSLYLHHLQRWCNVKRIVGLPLLDPSLPDEGLAAWIDEHTMAIHS